MASSPPRSHLHTLAGTHSLHVGSPLPTGDGLGPSRPTQRRKVTLVPSGVFVGDLGNETNDDVLAHAFSKYPSFQKAKVTRPKHTPAACAWHAH